MPFVLDTATVSVILAAFALTALLVISWLAIQRGRLLSDSEKIRLELENNLTASGELVNGLEQRLEDKQQQLDRLTAQHSDTLRQRDVLQSQLEHLTQSLTELRQRLDQREQTLQQTQRELAQQQATSAALRAELEQTRSAADDKLRMLSEARKELSHEFQNLAQKIFDEKNERFNRDSKTSLELTLKPLREQLGDFRKRVDDVYDRETRERASLRTELNQLKELNKRMSDEALNLTRALKGETKTQGNWGEVVLERVLEESGLRKGYEYETQVSLKSVDGERRAPDVIVRLPENKDVIIDAKVSLVHYERYCNAEGEEERQAALKQHIASVRAHISGLSGRDYENLEGVRSLDFVLIFIPVEAAFLTAFEHDSSVFREAYDKNIIVVSPTTLLATLRTVHSIWRYEHRNQNAERIALEAGRLHDQFARVLESLQELGRQLDKARESYDTTLKRFAEGRGNLVGRVDKLRRLGVKAKKSLPEETLALANDSDETLGLSDESI